MSKKYNYTITMNKAKDMDIFDFTIKDDRFTDYIHRLILENFYKDIDKLGKELGFDPNDVNMSGITLCLK